MVQTVQLYEITESSVNKSFVYEKRPSVEETTFVKFCATAFQNLRFASLHRQYRCCVLHWKSIILAVLSSTIVSTVQYFIADKTF